MKQTNTFCDRCLEPILSDGSVLSAEAGGLRRRRGPISIDLCVGCCAAFVAWLDSNPHDALRGLEPTEAVEPATVPA